MAFSKVPSAMQGTSSQLTQSKTHTQKSYSNNKLPF